ncbi:hypothetical protein Bbelb_098730 [Branchiostoma belcheri]|nr:hypothetical protein Bbelb_098730 [Branchiostoma belcheri]
MSTTPTLRKEWNETFFSAITWLFVFSYAALLPGEGVKRRTRAAAERPECSRSEPDELWKTVGRWNKLPPLSIYEKEYEKVKHTTLPAHCCSDSTTVCRPRATEMEMGATPILCTERNGT